MIFVISKVGAKSKYYFGLQQKNIGKLNGYVEEMIEGQKVIKVFCHEEEAIEDFKKHNEELRECFNRSSNIWWIHDANAW